MWKVPGAAVAAGAPLLKFARAVPIDREQLLAYPAFLIRRQRPEHASPPAFKTAAVIAPKWHPRGDSAVLSRPHERIDH